MSFNLTWDSKCEIQGTLKLDRDPFWYGLGHYVDDAGEVWDVAGIIGGEGISYIQARKISDAPSYYGTGMFDSSNGSHCWLPYLVEAPKPIRNKNKL